MGWMLLLVAIMIAVSIYHLISDSQKTVREDMEIEHVATRLDLNFSGHDAVRVAGFACLKSMPGLLSISRVVSGEYRGTRVVAFCTDMRPGSGRGRDDHEYYSAFVLDWPADVPRLKVVNGVARELQPSQVLEIRQRRSDSLANGAIIGAIAGAGLGILGALAVCFEEGCDARDLKLIRAFERLDD